ncbi:hypothetical protein LC605_31200, partial [Nostoc sp. CHAB 5836]
MKTHLPQNHNPNGVILAMHLNELETTENLKEVDEAWQALIVIECLYRCIVSGYRPNGATLI